MLSYKFYIFGFGIFCFKEISLSDYLLLDFVVMRRKW